MGAFLFTICNKEVVWFLVNDVHVLAFFHYNFSTRRLT